MYRTPGAESDPGAGQGHNTSMASIRKTLYHAPNTRVCYFYKDGDVNHPPIRLNVNPRHYGNLERLALDLQKKVKGLPNGVRSIYTPGGNDRISKINDLQDDGRYVMSTYRNRARGVDIARVHARRPWRMGRPPSARKELAGFLTDSDVDQVDVSRTKRQAWKSFTRSPQRKPLHAVQPPKKIEVIRNGDPSQKHVILLNRRTAQTFEQVLEDLGQMFQMPAKKMFTLQGRSVKSLSAIFNGPDMYVISRGERFVPMGALSDPGHLPPSAGKRKKTYNNDSVAAKLKNKRAKLSRTKGKWKVWVTTNDHPSAGTRAQVYITVYGSKGNSSPIPLGNADGETFQSGNIDEFEVSVGNIGEIYKIRMSHDHTGEDPGWLLDEVRMKDIHTDEQLVFRCKRWLSRDEDDHEICRELPATREGEHSLPITQYEVRVFTGDLWNAGTDANVYMTIYGQKGDTGVRQLIKSNMADKFAKGNEDVFIVEAVSLGNLSRVIMGHDGTGSGQGWYLDRVVVQEMPRGMTWTFPCDKWLDEDEEDGKIVRELKVADEYTNDVIEKAMWEFEKWKYSEHGQVLVYSRTTQLPMRIKQDGSVDANGDYVDAFGVFNVLGKKGTARTLQCATNPKFHLAIDNGKVMGLGKGGAYCEFKVRIQKDRSVLLESNKYPLQFLNIQPGGRPGDPRSGDIMDTAKQFFVYPKGIFRDQGVIVLNTSLKQTLNIDHDNTIYGTGKRNRLSHFRVHKVDEKIRMFESITFPGQYIRMQGGTCDCNGKGDQVCQFKVGRVKDACYITLESVASPGMKLGMMKDGKIRPTVDTGDKNVRFWPEVVTWGKPRGTQNTFQTEVKEEAPPLKSKPKMPRKTPIPSESPAPPAKERTKYDDGDWKLLIATEESAQDGRVAMVVYGNDGNSGEIVLGEAGENNMFHAGNQDQFKINLARIGPIFKVRLELHPLTKDGEASWKVKEVKMQDTQTKETLKFKFNTTLSRQSGDGTLMVEQSAVRPAKDILPVLKYRLAVETGNEPGSDTEARVYVTLFGERGDTGRRHLVKSENPQIFQQGQTDTFEIEAVSLGELKSCVIGHDGQAPGAGWKCERLRVTADDIQLTHFGCEKWLDSSVGDKKIERVLKPSDEPKPRSPTPKPRTPTPKPATPEVTKEKTQVEEEKVEEKKYNDGDYQIWITTGSEDTMATQNKVYVVAYGDKKKSDQVELYQPDSEQKLFEKSQTDEFQINLDSDLGDLYKIRIGHSDEDRQSGWFVEKVKLKNMVTDELFTFKVNRWMSRLHEDNDVWRELPVVSPGKTPLPVLPYVVEVYTGDQPGADTEANVYIQLIGQRGDTGKRVMFNSISDLKFQQGQCDAFRIEAVTLDEVKQVAIGHDGNGKGAGWYCERIVVKEGPDPDATAYHFPCARWLDVGQDDGQIERVLERGEAPKESQGVYIVYVKTAGDSNPPNSSLATITVYGEKGRSREMELSKEGAVVFQPDSTDEFEIAVGDIGDIYKIRVARKFDDTWEGWHLQEVKMQDKDTGTEHVFVFDSWLDLAKTEHDIAREMPIVTDGKPQLPIQTYEVQVYVGDHWAAETDANVYMTLYGSRGDSGKRYLHHPTNTKKKFCKNQMDEFLIQAVTLDDLERLIIGHDGVGHGAGFYLDKVVIREREGERVGKDFVFPCDCWLDDHEGDCKVERELRLAEVKDKDAKPAAPAGGVKTNGEWEVTVCTTDMPSSGTHAAVYLTVYGEKGNSGPKPLGEADPLSEEFKPGAQAKFNVSIGDLGELYKIRIAHDNSNPFPAWHIQQLAMKDKTTGEELSWHVNRWLSEEEEDGATCRELPIARPGQPVSPIQRYYVATYTANARNAGTNARVKITIFGSHGDTGARVLSESRTRQNPFLQGHIDVFTVEAVHLGSLQRILLEHDGTDAESSWFVDKVVVKESEASLFENEFPCRGWIEPGVGQPANMMLQTSGLQQASELPSEERALLQKEGSTESSGDWVVWTYTGVHTEEPTDTTVWLVLCGTHDTSERLPLKYQGEEDGDVISKRFLPGATDVFRVSAGDIGELMKIRLFVDPKGKNPNWCIEKIKMKDIRTKQEFHFNYNDWIRCTEGVDEEELVLELPTVRPDIRPLQIKNYQVAITTGDELRADTNAEIYFNLIGLYGETGKRRLLNTKDKENVKFRQGQTDMFEIPAVDLGPLKMAVIGHGVKGRGKGWLCDRVVVMDNPDSMTQTVFPCSQWLDTGVGDRRLERILLPLVSDLTIPAESDPSEPAIASTGQYKAFVTSGGAPNSNTGGNTNSSNNNTNNNNGGDSTETETEQQRCSVHSQRENYSPDSEGSIDIVTQLNGCPNCNSVRNCREEQTIQIVDTDEFSRQFYSDFYNDNSMLQPSMHSTELCDINPCEYCDRETSLANQSFPSPVNFLSPIHCHLNINNNASSRTGEVIDASNIDELELKPKVVTIMVYGDKKVAGPIELNNGDSDMFSAGKCDEFDLHVGDLGEIYKIRVTNALNKPWCIRDLILLDVTTKDKLLFDFSKFMGQEGGDIRKELPVVKPTKSVLPVLVYRVTIETQDTTDAQPNDECPDVFVRLFGERGDSGSRHLNKIDPEGASSLLQASSSATFMIEAVDLLCVTKVLVTKGRGASLSIKEVCVKKAEYTPEEWVFQYDSVISDDESRVTQQVVIAQSEARTCQAAAPLDQCPDLPKSEGMWNAWMRTGDEPGHETSSGVCMVVCGTQGESGDIPLEPFQSGEEGTDRSEKPDKPFQKGANDHFVFQLKNDIGELEKVRLTLTEPEDSPSWFIKDMRFEDQDTGDEFIIEVNDWLKVDEYEDGIREYPILWPGVTPKSAFKYVIETHTGDRSNAGTNSNVYINIHGKNGSSGKRLLKKSKNHSNKFEQGQKDKFLLELTDLGDLEKVIIGHDGDGIGSGWFLDKVIIKALRLDEEDEDDDVEIEQKDGEVANDDERKEKKQKYIFPCDRWLDVGEDDKTIERVLMRAEKEKTKIEGDPWKITVTTGDEANASTDDRVAIVIYGENCKSNRIYLGQGGEDGKGQYLGKGKMETFEELVKPGLGEIYKIRIGFGNLSEVSTTWMLDSVLLQNLKTGETYQFVYGDWIRIDDEHDGWVEIPLLKANPEEMLPVDKYTIRVQTGDGDGNGTDADVYVKLIGQRGDTGKRHLKQNIKDKMNKFESGAVDRFEIEAVNLGDIERILVGHNGEGFGSGWFLHSVLVKHEPEGKEPRKYYFHCDKWLEREQDDGLIERELILGEEPRTPEPPGTKWSVTIRNGAKDIAKDKDNLDSDEEKEIENEKKEKEEELEIQGEVNLVVYGSSGKSKSLALPSANKLRFNPTQTEQYEIFIEEDLGDVYKIRLQVTSDEKIRWPVEYVMLQRQEGAQLRFELNDEIVLNKRHDGVQEIALCTDTDHGALVPKLTTHKYCVEVYTGDKSGAGTDANVHVEITGARGDTGDRLLLHSLTNKKKFEADCKDVFILEAVDLDILKSVRVWHDGKGIGSGWYLNKIIVKESEEPQTDHIFQCDRWLDEGEDDNQTERVLELTTVKEREDVPWKLTLVTGNVEKDDDSSRKIKTNGQLVVAVYGEECGTPDYPLGAEPVIEINNPGNQQQFDIPLTEEVGRPYKVRLGFAGGTDGEQAILVQSLCLLETKTGTEYVYESTPGAWLIVDKEHDGWLELPLKPVNSGEKPLPVLKYHVEVYTGDKRGSGTDSHVYICIVGQRGDTGRRPLKVSKTYGSDPFEDDHMDLFELEAVQLLNPEKVIIGHDRSGSGWYLDKVIIKEARNSKKEFMFPCENWLSENEGDKLTERELILKPLEGKPYTLTTLASAGKGEDDNKDEQKEEGENPEEKREKEDDDEKRSIPGPAMLVLYGDQGRSKPVMFGDDLDFEFQRGESQTFYIHACSDDKEVDDIGEPYKVRVWLDPSDDTRDKFTWDLDKLTLKDDAAEKEYVFDMSDRKIKLNKEDDSMTEIPVTDDVTLPLREYYVEVHTAEATGSGTDANVYFQINGTRGDTGIRKLLVSSTEGNKFETGEMDVFNLPAVDLGELKSVVVGHDGKGFGSGWKLDKVIIKQHAAAEKAYIFQCNKWLDEGEDDGSLERTLELTKVDEEEPAASGDWRVLITSGDPESRGATNAQVHMQVFGDTGDSGPLPLGEPDQGLFQAGSTDQFDIFLNPDEIGKLRKIRIWHDNKEENPGWFLQKITMEEEKSKTVLEMPVNRWLHMKKEDGDITREIVIVWPREEPATVTTYEVEIETGKKFGGGTDAHPYITLCGKQGDSGKRFLSKNKEETEDMFEAGKTDTFCIEAIGLGDLTHVIIGHDQDGGGSGWYLERVLVKPGADSPVKLIFPCNQWLDKDEGDKLTERTLQLAGTETTDVIIYEVEVVTGKAFGGGTDAHPYITLFGDKGDSGKKILDKNKEGGDMFEAGKTDTFEIETPDLGTLSHVIIGHDRDGSGAGWFLDKVQVRAGPQADVKSIFPCDSWLDKDEGDKQTERTLKLSGTEPIQGNNEESKNDGDESKDN